MNVTLIGIDLAKNVFQICGVNQAGKSVFNKQVKRQKVLETVLRYPDAVIAMEACSGSNYYSRVAVDWGSEKHCLSVNTFTIHILGLSFSING